MKKKNPIIETESLRIRKIDHEDKEYKKYEDSGFKIKRKDGQEIRLLGFDVIKDPKTKKVIFGLKSKEDFVLYYVDRKSSFALECLQHLKIKLPNDRLQDVQDSINLAYSEKHLFSK